MSATRYRPRVFESCFRLIPLHANEYLLPIENPRHHPEQQRKANRVRHRIHVRAGKHVRERTFIDAVLQAFTAELVHTARLAKPACQKIDRKWIHTEPQERLCPTLPPPHIDE